MNMTWARLKEPRLYWLATSVHNLKWYYTPTLVGVGTICNFLSIHTFMRGKLKQYSCTPYLITLSIVDIIFLLTFFVAWLHVLGIDAYNIGGGCQAITFASSVCSFVSLWCTTFAVIDRTVLTHQSTTHRSKQICSPVSSTLIAILCVAVSLVVYLNISLLYGVVHIQPGLSFCMPLSTNIKTILILGHADAVWNFGIPYLSMLFFISWNCR